MLKTGAHHLPFTLDDLFESPREPPSPHPASLPEAELIDDCELTRGRTGGPGGQHRNKTETHVMLRHKPTGVTAQAGERRSPEANRRVAVRRLRLNLAVQIRMQVPAGDVRSELWRSRCKDGKIVCNPKHADYPALLAEAMDMIEACKSDVKKASVRLECSMSQLLRLLRCHPEALEAVNNARRERGLHPMK